MDKPQNADDSHKYREVLLRELARTSQSGAARSSGSTTSGGGGHGGDRGSSATGTLAIPRGALLVTHQKRVTNSPKSKSKGGRNRKVKAQVTGLVVTEMRPGPTYPPSYNAIPTYHVKRRFVSAEDVAVSNSEFQLRHGHNQFLVATDTSTLLPYVEMWRIRKISVWAINYVDNATTATIFPVGTDIDSNSFNDRERAFTCSSRSEASPGHMAIVPARDTPLGSWHKTSTVNSNGTLFVMNVDYGGASSGNWATVTLDIDFEIVLNTFGASPGYSRSVAASAIVGTMYGANWPATSSSFLLQSVNKV